MASLWCCHTEDVYGEILPHKRKCVCVWMCLCAERATVLWSSDCKPVAFHMINQTDWMGQIWFVIGQKERQLEKERLLGGKWSVWLQARVCEGTEVCIEEAEVKLMYAWGSRVKQMEHERLKTQSSAADTATTLLISHRGYTRTVTI